MLVVGISPFFIDDCCLFFSLTFFFHLLVSSFLYQFTHIHRPCL